MFDKLEPLVAAALTPNAVEYKLQLSVVLKGARGSGKMTAIRNVSRQLGMHLLEVTVYDCSSSLSVLMLSKLDCYDILGDTDAQTEGALRARFEKAASCSPCILVLRHVDALSQTTQSSEPGKGVLPPYLRNFRCN